MLTPREAAALAADELLPDEVRAPADSPRARRLAALACGVAAKEAGYKALTQAGLQIPSGGWLHLELAPDARRVTHLLSGVGVALRWRREGAALRCLALHAAGGTPRWGDLADACEERAGRDASEAARELLRALIAARHPDVADPRELSVGARGEVPVLLWRGERQPWSVSLSHAGAYVACAYLAEAP
ncbi:MAG: hypothetical protein AB7N76_24200 [Planctomycetota bacterium]